VSSHVVILPFTKKSNNKVASESGGQNLGEEVDIRDEGSLEDDGDVGGVEQFNRVRLLQSSLLSSRQLNHNLEVLEINYDDGDENGGY